ncbi:hypothetical protein DFJ73DRAFT_929906 [Zopfochytrium polystomum]|nr:hypothetical protein DFJ73DRAFT_929906 [Zopfochytrium polystomum]
MADRGVNAEGVAAVTPLDDNGSIPRDNGAAYVDGRVQASEGDRPNGSGQSGGGSLVPAAALGGDTGGVEAKRNVLDANTRPIGTIHSNGAAPATPPSPVHPCAETAADSTTKRPAKSSTPRPRNGISLDNIIWSAPRRTASRAASTFAPGDSESADSADRPSPLSPSSRRRRGSPHSHPPPPSTSSRSSRRTASPATPPPDPRPTRRSARFTPSSSTADDPTPRPDPSSLVPVLAATPALAELRGLWEFAAVAQFFALFSSALRIRWRVAAAADGFGNAAAGKSKRARKLDEEEEEERFETEDLETFLLAPDPSPIFTEVHVKLLRTLTQNRYILSDNWTMYYRREEYRYGVLHTAFPEGVEYRDVKLLDRWQLEHQERFRVATRADNEVQHWRVDPIGWDSKGNTYWMFDDNRLYREAPLWIRAQRKTNQRSTSPSSSSVSASSTSHYDPVLHPPSNPPVTDPTAPRRRFDLVCLTSEDWMRLPAHFAASKHELERDLHRFLVDQAVPRVVPLLRKKEDDARRRQQQQLGASPADRLRAATAAALANSGAAATTTVRASVRIAARALEREERARAERDAAAAAAAAARLLDSDRRTRAITAAAAAVSSVATAAPRESREERLAKRRRALDAAEQDDRADGVKRLKVDQIGEGEGDAVAVVLQMTDGDRGDAAAAAAPSEDQDDDDDEWEFDCPCGVAGRNWDDGRPMIACGRCSRWQHLACAEAARRPGSRWSDGSAGGKWETEDFVCRHCVALVAATVVTAGPVAVAVAPAVGTVAEAAWGERKYVAAAAVAEAAAAGGLNGLLHPPHPPPPPVPPQSEADSRSGDGVGWAAPGGLAAPRDGASAGASAGDGAGEGILEVS